MATHSRVDLTEHMSHLDTAYWIHIGYSWPCSELKKIESQIFAYSQNSHSTKNPVAYYRQDQKIEQKMRIYTDSYVSFPKDNDKEIPPECLGADFVEGSITEVGAVGTSEVRVMTHTSTRLQSGNLGWWGSKNDTLTTWSLIFIVSTVGIIVTLMHLRDACETWMTWHPGWVSVRTQALKTVKGAGHYCFIITNLSCLWSTHRLSTERYTGLPKLKFLGQTTKRMHGFSCQCMFIVSMFWEDT